MAMKTKVRAQQEQITAGIIPVPAERVHETSTQKNYGDALRVVDDTCDLLVEQGQIAPGRITADAFVKVFRKFETAGCSASRVRQYVAAVSAKAVKRGYGARYSAIFNSKVSKEVSEICRRIGRRAKNAVIPMPIEVVREAAVEGEALKGTMKSRKLATELMQFCSFCRTSEVRALQVQDLKIETQEGRRVLMSVVRRSKTDQAGRGRVNYIYENDQPYNAVSWVDGLLNAKEWKPTDHPFSTAAVMNPFLQAQAARLLPRLVPGAAGARIGTHSLRKGAAHAAALLKVPAYVVKAQGGWLSDEYTVYTDVSGQEAGRLLADFF